GALPRSSASVPGATSGDRRASWRLTSCARLSSNAIDGGPLAIGTACGGGGRGCGTPGSPGGAAGAGRFVWGGRVAGGDGGTRGLRGPGRGGRRANARGRA